MLPTDRDGAPREILLDAGNGELSDDELEYVVGGLTRPWEEPVLPWDPAPRLP